MNLLGLKWYMWTKSPVSVRFDLTFNDGVDILTKR